MEDYTLNYKAIIESRIITNMTYFIDTKNVLIKSHRNLLQNGNGVENYQTLRFKNNHSNKQIIQDELWIIHLAIDFVSFIDNKKCYDVTLIDNYGVVHKQNFKGDRNRLQIEYTFFKEKYDGLEPLPNTIIDFLQSQNTKNFTNFTVKSSWYKNILNLSKNINKMNENKQINMDKIIAKNEINNLKSQNELLIKKNNELYNIVEQIKNYTNFIKDEDDFRNVLHIMQKKETFNKLYEEGVKNGIHIQFDEDFINKALVFNNLVYYRNSAQEIERNIYSLLHNL